MKRGLAWLFAALWFAAFTLALPRASALAHETTRAPSASVSPARDAGVALSRSAPVISVVAPAPEPVPPALPARRDVAVNRAPYRALDARLRAAPAASVRVVRWQRHIPRMDSGEPPWASAVSS